MVSLEAVVPNAACQLADGAVWRAGGLRDLRTGVCRGAPFARQICCGVWNCCLLQLPAGTFQVSLIICMCALETP